MNRINALLLDDRMCSVVCPDCHTSCTFVFSVLTPDGYAIHMTACKTCKDHKTMRVVSRIRLADVLHTTGSPIVLVE